MLKSATLLASGLLAIAGAAAFAEGETMDTVVATVDGHEITLGQMIITRAQLPAQYQQLPDDVLFKGILDQLIQQQLLADQVEGMPKRVAAALVNEERSMLAGEAIDDLAKVAVTEEAIQADYDAMFADAAPETEYNASHILVATEEEINAAKARIDAGEDFAAVATEISTDTSGPGGGSLGWFGKGMMVPEFENAVIALEPGQVSEPVQTQFGWHLVKLNETREKEQPSLDELRGEIVAKLEEQAIQAALAELESAASVTRPEEGAFDPALIKNMDLLVK
ncbi:MAG: peptidylprolyl isomerase [Rhodobacteraceae bacterium]|nr:peptidylprolyl isomerase [Paracoccaceae bacterium]